MEGLKKMSSNTDLADLAMQAQHVEQQPMTVVLTDTDSAIFFKNYKETDQYINRDGTINKNGTIINQNYIEQYGRKQLSQGNDKYMDALYDIFTETLGIDKKILSKENFSAKIKLSLKKRGDFLSNTLTDIASSQSGLEKGQAKKIVDSEIYPHWINTITKQCLEEHKVLTDGKQFIVDTKVGASTSALAELCNTLKASQDNMIYLEGCNSTQLYDYTNPDKKNVVPYVLDSGNYDNHEMKFSNLIEKNTTEESFIYMMSANGEDFYTNFFKRTDREAEKTKKEFFEYLQNTVDVEKNKVKNSIQAVCPNITSVKLTEIPAETEEDFIENVEQQLANIGKRQQTKRVGNII